MLGSLGPAELLIIFLIVLVLFGARKLPMLGKGLGEGIRNFKHGLTGDKADNETSESNNDQSS
jgi:sec-independent protein translocase protein TatA